MKLKAAMEFAANCSSRCSEVKASPDEALTDSTKEVAPAKIDLQLTASRSVDYAR